MVSVDDLGVVLSQALDHMTVEVEQIEIARLLPRHDGDEPRVVGRQGWHRPIAGRPNLREAPVLELEQAPTLGQEHRSGQRERRLGHRRELHALLDSLALESAEIKVDA